MSFSKERIFYLLRAWSNKKTTSSEEQELIEIISQKQGKDALYAHIDQLINEFNSNELMPATDWENAYEQIMQKRQLDESKQPKVVRFTWLKWSAAAAILLLLASAVYLKLTTINDHTSIAKNDKGGRKNDIAPPGVNKAILKLGNGKVIILDSAGMGSLASEGVGNARKLNENELAYNADAAMAPELHTLQVPNGSRPMQLRLADGSEVWLNAGSSITFPNIFPGKDRRVSVVGEAYFEVAKNANKSFTVEANGTSTEVLGTRFNVNAYSNEPGIKITLLDGAVKVNKEGRSAQLKPGQQALLAGSSLNVSDNADINEVMAWKNGLFVFDNMNMEQVMRQIERWYDVEVVFKGNVREISFTGVIPRNDNLSKVLRVLESTGGLKFEINEKSILVNATKAIN